MKIETKLILGSLLALSLIIGAIIYDRSEKECNMKIVLESGDTCTARRVNFYNSGFSDIQKCNGERMTLRTSNIDTIITIHEK